MAVENHNQDKPEDPADAEIVNAALRVIQVESERQEHLRRHRDTTAAADERRAADAWVVADHEHEFEIKPHDGN